MENPSGGGPDCLNIPFALLYHPGAEEVKMRAVVVRWADRKGR